MIEGELLKGIEEMVGIKYLARGTTYVGLTDLLEERVNSSGWRWTNGEVANFSEGNYMQKCRTHLILLHTQKEGINVAEIDMYVSNSDILLSGK